tara:strand:- start:8992 stop:9354 length:363 start_codon:yes stop_codon:yes gene_type:complete
MVFNVLIISLYFIPAVCYCMDERDAIRYTERALQRTKPAKKLAKKVDKMAKKTIKEYSIPEWSLAAAAVVIKVNDTKEISTRDLAPKMKMEIGDMDVRPAIRYDLEDGAVSGTIDLNMGF